MESNRRIAIKLLSGLIASASVYAQTGAPLDAAKKPIAPEMMYVEFLVSPRVAKGSYAALADALRAAAELRHKNPSVPLRIRVEPGDYYLDAPLKIGPELSGTKDAPTEIIAVDPAEPPRLLAGRQIEAHWKPWRNGIWQTQVSGAAFDQIYLDGAQQIRARYPNYDAKIKPFDGYAADALSPERIARWKNPSGGVVHALDEKRWGAMQIPILGKNADGSLKLGEAVGNNRPTPPHAQYRYVENVFEELDAPGEWFLDTAQSTLYYMPAAKLDPSTGKPNVQLQQQDLNRLKLEVSGPARLFDLQGTQQTPLRHLRISGLTLQHAGTSFLRNTEPLVRSDWMLAREGAVFLEGTEDVSIDSNEFSNSGGNAVFVSGYNRRAVIAGNHIHDMGAGGIDFVGRSDAVRSPSFRYEEFVPYEKMDLKAGPKSENYPADSEASDNLIYRIGAIEKLVAGVDIDMAMNIHVAHNSIYQVPRAGINVGDGTWGGHVIEYNDVFDTVLETGDHGAFNSWGRDRLWHPDFKTMEALNLAHPGLWKLDVLAPITLRHNRLRCDHGWDIDIDDGSSNYRIYDNVLLSGGLKLREGFSREAWNNVVINNSLHPHVWFKDSNDLFERNIVMGPYQPVLMEHWDAKIDYNVFPTKAALDAAQELGLDRHSKFGEPQFLDVTHGDYRVAEKSPALALGFKNFTMDEFGVRPAKLKVLARQPTFPELASTAERTPDKRYPFYGAQVKTVATLGEQSGAGLAEIAGVLVLDVPAQSMAAKWGLKARDVVIGATGDSEGNRDERIDNVADLQRLTKGRTWHGTIKLVVVRNQQKQNIVIDVAQQ